MTQETLKELPKIELHCHLDGSLSRPFIEKRLGRTVRPEELSVSENCTSLNEYLEKFEFPLTLLQKAEAITECVRMLIAGQDSQGIMYSEIRFAPQLHMQKGLTQEEVVQAAIKGLGNSDYHKLILCCMRGSDNEELNKETIRIAHTYLGRGVVALDLAGAEKLYPTKQFVGIFKEALAYNIPFTIHAGEADGEESIKTAIYMGAERIGHGIRAAWSEDMIKELADKNIPLELCPTSNLNTKVVDNIADYPIMKLINNGVKVTINTDNMMVSGTSIKNELKLLVQTFPINGIILKNLLINSAEAAFAKDSIKEQLKRKIYEELDGVTYE